MAGLAAGILAAAEFLDDEFFAFVGPEDLSRDRRSSNRGSTQLQVARAIGDGQHFLEGELVAGGEIAIVDREFLAFFYFELSTTI